MSVWMQAKQPIYGEIDEHGNRVAIQPGDFFQVGRQRSVYYEASGQAVIPEYFNQDYKVSARNLYDCGFVITAGYNTQEIENGFPEVPIKHGKPELLYPRNMLWDTSYNVRTPLIPIGFYRLERGWQICAPLFSYNKLARDIETEEERQKTLEIIHDLRVPVYDTRLMFVRDCPQMQELIGLWQSEGGGKLAFMRALYQVKPIINALPCTWHR